MVAEAGLELKEEQSSQNERKKQEAQKKKICQERPCRQPPEPRELCSAAHMATNTLIMTLDTGPRPRHQVDRAEEQDTLLCSSCKALAHMCFANCISRALWRQFV